MCVCFKIKCSIAECSTNDKHNSDYKQKDSEEGSLCWEVMKRNENVLFQPQQLLCPDPCVSLWQPSLSAPSFLTSKTRSWSHDHPTTLEPRAVQS